MARNNHAAPLPSWRKGQRLHRVYINQLVDHANALATITGGPGIQITRTAGAVAIAATPHYAHAAIADSFLARITASASGAHGWMEMQPASEGSFMEVEGGRSGTTSANPAYEINGRSNVPANTIVQIKTTLGSDSTTKYTFSIGAAHSGTAATMSYSGEHADDASTSTWDINSQSSSRGVNLTVQTGQRYDHTAESPTLYAYLRNLSFDANGQLVAISAESRVIIDSPEACS